MPRPRIDPQRSWHYLSPRMAKDINAAVREVCLSFPEAEEYLSHGSPNFRVRGKTFATYAVNHHGDGRVALWLCAPPGSQELHVKAEPKYYFVPPYVGPRGFSNCHIRCARTVGHSLWVMLYTQVSRIVPLRARWWLRRTPSSFAPNRSMPARLW